VRALPQTGCGSDAARRWRRSNPADGRQIISQLNGELNMGRFDSRNTTKMRQRRAQAKKKARAERRAEETRAERKGKGKGKS
jgi:hypothetical protein